MMWPTGVFLGTPHKQSLLYPPGIDPEPLLPEGQHAGWDREPDVCGLPEDTGHVHLLLVPDDLSPAAGPGDLPPMERGRPLLYSGVGGAHPHGPPQLVRGGQTTETQRPSPPSQGSKDETDDRHT